MGAKDKKQNFETRISRLEEIVTALESDKISLDQGMALYREGMECVQVCRKRLDEARHELRLWQDGEERNIDSATLANIRRNEE